MSTPLLEVHHVGFSYGSREIVVGADFALEPGTATALIGPNGVGKTTLLRLASGVLQPTSGSIDLTGVPLQNLPCGKQPAQSQLFLSNWTCPSTTRSKRL